MDHTNYLMGNIFEGFNVVVAMDNTWITNEENMFSFPSHSKTNRLRI